MSLQTNRAAATAAAAAAAAAGLAMTTIAAILFVRLLQRSALT